MGFLKDHSFFFAVIGSAALIVTIYHCLLSIFCHPRQQQPQDVEQQQEDTDVAQIDVRQSIPVYKFITGKSPSGECPVCLSEFEDGEELRVLPKCLHSFHVVCIDKWLHSHPNCPTCRTDAMSIPPLQVVGVMDSGSNVGRSGILVSSISPDLEAQQQTSVR